jgi:hypothetical protein
MHSSHGFLVVRAYGAVELAAAASEDEEAAAGAIIHQSREAAGG